MSKKILKQVTENDIDFLFVDLDKTQIDKSNGFRLDQRCSYGARG